MPSKSKAQARLMAMAAHNPTKAAELKIPLKVAKEFNTADRRDGMLKKANKRPK